MSRSHAKRFGGGRRVASSRAQLVCALIAAQLMAGCGGCGRTGYMLPERPHLLSVSLEPESCRLVVGQQLTPRILGAFDNELPRELRSDEVTWSSSSSSIVSIQNGKLVANAPGGPVRLLATTALGEHAVDVVVVNADPVALVIRPERSILAVKDAVRLVARLRLSDGSELDVSRSAFGTTWASSDESALELSDEGLATAKKASPLVRVSARHGEWSAEALVRVTDAAVVMTGLSLRPARPTLAIGSHLALGLVATLDDGSEWDVTSDERVSWSVSDPAGVSVTSGVIEALASRPNPVPVSAFFGGLRASTSVSVVAAQVTSIELSPAHFELSPGAFVHAGVVARFDDGHSETWRDDPRVEWSSSDTARVTATSGVVMGLAAGGPVEIRASFLGLNATAAAEVAVSRVGRLSVASSIGAALGERFPIVVDGVADDGSSRNVSSESSGTAYRVEPAGLVVRESDGFWRAVRPGGPVSISIENGDARAKTTVRIDAPPTVRTSLEIEGGDALTLAPSASQALVVHARLGDGRREDVDASELVFFSMDPSVAAVDADGLVSAIGAGGPVPVIVSFRDLSAELNVTVAPPEEPASALVVEPSEVKGKVGARVRLSATATMADGASVDVTGLKSATWRVVSGAGVVKLEGPGRILLVDAGSAELEVAYGMLTRRVPIEVSARALTDVGVRPDEMELPVGFSDRLTVIGAWDDGSSVDLTRASTGTTYTSEDVSVATVSEDGVVQAMGSGSTRITAVNGSFSRRVTVRVRDVSVKGVAISPPEVRLDVGASRPLSCLASLVTERIVDASDPLSGTIYTSSRPDVVRVSANGLVVGLAQGTSDVTCLQRGGASSVRVTVGPATAVESRLTLGRWSLPLGGAQPLVFAGRGADGNWWDLSSSADVTLSIDSPSAAQLGPDGVVVGRAAGAEAVLTVEQSDAVTQLPFRVAPAAVERFDCLPLILRVAASSPLSFELVFSDGTRRTSGGSVVWRSADPSIATVDGAGAVKGVSSGMTVVFGHSGGRTARCAVEVQP